MTRWCELAVECSRSMASVAMVTAESNPNETSVPQTSLSIVLGTETTFTPAWASLAAVFWVPFPPIHTIQSRPRSWIFFNIKAGLSSEAADRRFLNGFSLEVPSIVPPRFNKPDNDFSVNGSTSLSSNPRNPL